MRTDLRECQTGMIRKNQYYGLSVKVSFPFTVSFPVTATGTVVKSILQLPRLALRCHEHVAQLRRSAAADPVDPVGHGTILCSGFTLVVNLFNKDDADDGGLSFFYSAETQSTNYLDTRLSPSLRLSLAERERTHLTPSAAN